RFAAIFVPIAIAIGGVTWMHLFRPDPKSRPPQERGRPVRDRELAMVAALPRAAGYRVERKREEWQGGAEVSGRVIALGERLEVGRTIEAGSLLLRIDPGSYELEKLRSESTAKAVRAQIGELSAREKSAKATLRVEERGLAMAQRDLENLRTLYAQGNVP